MPDWSVLAGSGKEIHCPFSWRCARRKVSAPPAYIPRIRVTWKGLVDSRDSSSVIPLSAALGVTAVRVPSGPVVTGVEGPGSATRTDATVAVGISGAARSVAESLMSQIPAEAITANAAAARAGMPAGRRPHQGRVTAAISPVEPRAAAPAATAPLPVLDEVSADSRSGCRRHPGGDVVGRAIRRFANERHFEELVAKPSRSRSLPRVDGQPAHQRGDQRRGDGGQRTGAPSEPRSLPTVVAATRGGAWPVSRATNVAPREKTSPNSVVGVSSNASGGV